MSKRILALAISFMTLVVLCGAPAASFAYDGNVIKKEETVYVITDSHGNQNDVIVSDQLCNEQKLKTITDETTLSDIENVKGDEKFKQKGHKLEWAANGKDIFYQGRTDEEVPVSINVTYTLDGQSISGPDLQGKSGDVVINVKFINNGKYNGNTVPFIVLTGLIVTDDSFTDVKVDHGKILDDGNKQIVAGIAAPGLAQTLDISEAELGFGDSIRISGKAKKFAVEDMMTIVTNSVFEDVDADTFDELDFDDQIEQLDKGSKQLVEGSKDLYNGIEMMNDSKAALADAVNQLNAGSNGLSTNLEKLKQAAFVNNTYIQLTSKIVDYIPEIKAKASSLNSKIEEMNEPDYFEVDAVKEIDEISEFDILSDDISKLKELRENASDEEKESYNKIISDIEKISTDEKNIVDTINSQVKRANIEIQEKAQDVNNEIETLEDTRTELKTLATDADKLNEIKKYFQEGTVFQGIPLPSWYTTANTLDGAITSGLNPTSMEFVDGPLVTGAKQLAYGMSQLNSKTGTLVDGITKIDAGSYQISKGMEKLYKDGIKKIVDLYNDDLKGLTDGLDSMMDAGKGYKTFTKLPANMDGNVKFIYKTTISK